jgi:hypothetical protein
MQQSSMINNSTVLVQFPPLLIPNYNVACSIVSGTFNGPLNCSTSPQNLSFVIVTLSTNIPSNTSFQITISGVRNPPSYAPISNFILTTRLPNPTYLYSNQTQPPGFVNSWPSSFALISYTFTPLTFDTSTTLQITFQPSYTGIAPKTL